MMNSRGPKKASQKKMPLVALRRVSRFYTPEKSALFDISFDLWPGEFVYITGTSGAGKSTLMRLLHMAESPDTGMILFNGHNIGQLKKTAISVLRRSMGVVFQDFRLIHDISVAANIALPLEIMGHSSKNIHQQVNVALEQVELSGRGKEIAGAMSGGEQQRIAIARAIVSKPEIILADEPTGSLDAYCANTILDMLETICAQGTTIVLASHDRMLMAARPHRTITLDKGRLVGSSPAVDSNIAPRSTPDEHNINKAG